MILLASAGSSPYTCPRIIRFWDTVRASSPGPEWRGEREGRAGEVIGTAPEGVLPGVPIERASARTAERCPVRDRVVGDDECQCNPLLCPRCSRPVSWFGERYGMNPSHHVVGGTAPRREWGARTFAVVWSRRITLGRSAVSADAVESYLRISSRAYLVPTTSRYLLRSWYPCI